MTTVAVSQGSRVLLSQGQECEFINVCELHLIRGALFKNPVEDDTTSVFMDPQNSHVMIKTLKKIIWCTCDNLVNPSFAPLQCIRVKMHQSGIRSLNEFF